MNEKEDDLAQTINSDIQEAKININSEGTTKSLFDFFRSNLKDIVLSKLFLILIFLNVKFSFTIIVPSLFVSVLLDLFTQMNFSIQNFMTIYNFFLKVTASIFFLILGLKYILDNTRFSIKDNSSKDQEKANDNKANFISEDPNLKLGINCDSLNEITTDKENEKSNVNYNSKNQILHNIKIEDNIQKENLNKLNAKINTSNSEFEMERDGDNEKSSLLCLKTEGLVENKENVGFSASQFCKGIENVFLCVLILFLTSLLDKKKEFLNPEILKNFIFIGVTGNQSYKSEFFANGIGSLFAFLFAFGFARLLNKFLEKKKIIFYFGFFILIFFGIYSIYKSVSNKKTYHLRKIMLSNRTEKNNPNVFLKKKDLELHFIVNNSKLVKNKILNRKKLKKKLLTMAKRL